MKNRIDAFLGDVTLTTLALAIAVGWALFQAASGLANTVTVLLTHFPSGDLGPHYFGVLAWRVGGRILAVGDLAKGLIELAVVISVAAFIQTRRTADQASSGHEGH